MSGSLIDLGQNFVKVVVRFHEVSFTRLHTAVVFALTLHLCRLYLVVSLEETTTLLLRTGGVNNVTTCVRVSLLLYDLSLSSCPSFSLFFILSTVCLTTTHLTSLLLCASSVNNVTTCIRVSLLFYDHSLSSCLSFSLRSFDHLLNNYPLVCS